MLICSVCGKKPSRGNKVSHSNMKTLRSWKPNLQKVRIQDGKTTKKVYVCTKCLKAGKVKKV